MKIAIIAHLDSDRDTTVAHSARLLCEAVSMAGHDTALSCRMARGPVPSEVMAHTTTEMSEGWRRHGVPDVVHAIGERSVRVALEATDGLSIPVIATLVGDSAISTSEQQLAQRVDRLLVQSAAEARRWAALGTARERIDVFHLPSPTLPDQVVDPRRPGYVVTDANGDELEAIIASMPAWGARHDRPRLVAVSQGTAAHSTAQAGSGATGRALVDVECRPGLRGVALSDVVGGALIAIAVEPHRDGGLALEAGRHGVPSIAADNDPLNDLVINGATGLVVPDPVRADTIARAVRHLLDNQVVLEGCGAGALRRVRAVRNPDMAAHQALAAYAAATPNDDQTGDHATEGATADADDAIDVLVTEHLSLARALAQRYAGRGQALDELIGVANLGLVKAAERFDPQHGSAFASFAVPTILGELRRYFRDHAWSLRVPRSLQEKALDVERAADDLRGELGGDPTHHQLAEQLNLSDDDVARARQVRYEALSSTSLDRPVADGSDAVLGDLLGTEDDRYGGVEEVQAVRDALRRLPDRERDVLVMSFYGERTQSEIADHLGISQVHVSRTLAKTLATLRRHVIDEVPLPDNWCAPRRPEPDRHRVA